MWKIWNTCNVSRVGSRTMAWHMLGSCYLCYHYICFIVMHLSWNGAWQSLGLFILLYLFYFCYIHIYIFKLIIILLYIYLLLLFIFN